MKRTHKRDYCPSRTVKEYRHERTDAATSGRAHGMIGTPKHMTGGLDQADWTNFKTDKRGIQSRKFNPTKIMAKYKGKVVSIQYSYTSNQQVMASLYAQGYLDAQDDKPMPDSKLARMRPRNIIAYRNGYRDGATQKKSLAALIPPQC